MKIIHLEHSAFCVQKENILILFDCFDKICLPSDDTRETYIFSSHHHKDHFSLDVLEKFKNYENIYFIFSYDIKRNFKKEIDESYPMLKESIYYLYPNRQVEIKNLSVKTLGSTDAGVAFLVKLQDISLFHAGDLHLWIWKEESDDYNQKMRKRYYNEINKLKDENIDYAFYPLDLRQEDYFLLGLEYFLSKVKIKKVFPMHFFNDYSVNDKLKQSSLYQEHKEKIIEVSHQDQVFEF